MLACTSTASGQGKLRGALKYAELGWRIHPTHWIRPGGRCSCTDADCALGLTRAAGKHPLIRGWRDKATTDPSTIREWWTRAPNANVAVATGPGSNLLVIDIDGQQGEIALIELEHTNGQLPDLYPMQWTGSGRGWQALFAFPAGRSIGNTVSTLGPAIDTRGAGGYVLIPPSRTVQTYHWAADRDPCHCRPRRHRHGSSSSSIRHRHPSLSARRRSKSRMLPQPRPRDRARSPSPAPP